MRYRSLDSIMSVLKIESGNPNIDQYKPELAQWVGTVERNLGLNRAALHSVRAVNVPVIRSQAALPLGFFELHEMEDYCLDRRLRDMTCCQCRCSPCHCGWDLMNSSNGTFDFHDTVVDCPFTTGSITFWYWSLEMDRDGLPMILESHVEAYNAFVISIFKKGEMNAGILNPQIYAINKKDWEDKAVYARARDNNPTKQQIIRANEVVTGPTKFM